MSYDNQQGMIPGHVKLDVILLKLAELLLTSPFCGEECNHLARRRPSRGSCSGYDLRRIDTNIFSPLHGA